MSRFKRTETKPQIEKPKQDIILTKEDSELVIDETNLNRELMDQPLLFRKYTRILSQLNRKAKAIKAQLERTEAKIYVEVSKDGTGKRVKEVESAVMLNEEVIKLREELYDAEQMVEEFTGIVKSFHQRHEALKDLCANKRKELVD